MASMGPSRLALALSLAALALAACADLPRIESGVCGNAVIDPGEDCDSHVDDMLGTSLSCAPASDSARACRYVCSDNATCPIGWGCGEGGVCRFASGAFISAPPVRLVGERLDVADYDGDGHQDLLGFQGATIEIAYGAGDGSFPTLNATVTGFPSGGLGLGEVSGDVRRDVVVPTNDGLFVLTGSAARTLDPIAYAAIAIPIDQVGLQVLPVLAIDNSPFEVPMIMLASCMSFQFEGVDLASCVSPGTKLPEIPGLPLNDRFTVADLRGRVARGNLDGPASPDEEVALAPVAGTGVAARTVYLFRPKLIEVAPAGPCRCPGGDDECNIMGQDVRCVPTLEGFGQVSVLEDILLGARFADLEGDGDLDLLVSTGLAGDDHVAVAFNDGAGKFFAADGTPNVAKTDDVFDALLVAVGPEPGGGEPSVGVVPQRWPLAVGSFNPDTDAVADFVGQFGVYVRFGFTSFTFQTFVNASTTPYSEAEATDLNRDGLVDVVVARAGGDGIDFLGGVGNGLFNPAHLDTVDVPFALRTGDFDGDLVADLAFGEHGVLSGRGDDSLSVCFGNLQGPPGAPVSMGRLGAIEFMEPTRIITSVSNIDMISDLLVQSTQSAGGRTLAALIGSAQRRLLSPLTLQPMQDKDADVPIGVVTGQFSEDTIPDLLVLAPPRVWLLEGSGEAQFPSTGTHEVGLAELLGGVGAESFNGFCSVFAVGRVDADALDDVVVLDNNARCFGQGMSPPPFVVVLSRTPGGAKPFSVSLGELGPDLVAPVDAQLADMDGDGQNDLVVVFRGDRFFDDSTGPMVEKGGVAIYWGNGIDFDLGAPLVLGGLAVNAAAPINADADTAPELAVAATEGVFVFGITGRAFEPAPGVSAALSGRALAARDVDGDGLQDLLVLDEGGGQVHVLLAIPQSGGDLAVGGVMP